MIISIARTIILYFFAMFAIRLMGKRQIGELQPSELVITMLISELATLPMQDFDIPLVLGIIPITVLVFFEHITSFISIKSVKFRRFINGNPCVVIHNGEIKVKVLRDLRLSVDELLEELRICEITDISDVQYAIIETNGQLSCICYSHLRNIERKDLNIEGDATSLPLIIVNDGSIIERNLLLLEKDKNWLLSHIKGKKIPLKSIFLMTLDISGNIFIQTKEV